MDKKSKPTIYLACIAFIFLVNNSCKKYPDGPLINLMSEEKRLKRTWYIEYLEIGGIDSTMQLFVENDSGYKFNSMVIEDDKDGSGLFFKTLSQNYGTVYFQWSFADNKKKLIIRKVYEYLPFYFYKDRVGPFWVYEDVEYRIRKLTKNELWLETTYNGFLTKAHFKDN